MTWWLLLCCSRIVTFYSFAVLTKALVPIFLPNIKSPSDLRHSFKRPAELRDHDVFMLAAAPAGRHTRSSRFSSRMTQEQPAHSWRRATRLTEKWNTTLLSLTQWVPQCVYVWEDAVHFITLLCLSKEKNKKTPKCNRSVSLQTTHKLSCGICCVGVRRFIVQFCLVGEAHMKLQTEYV